MRFSRREGQEKVLKDRQMAGVDLSMHWTLGVTVTAGSPCHQYHMTMEQKRLGITLVNLTICKIMRSRLGPGQGLT